MYSVKGKADSVDCKSASKLYKHVNFRSCEAKTSTLTDAWMVAGYLKAQKSNILNRIQTLDVVVVNGRRNSTRKLAKFAACFCSSVTFCELTHHMYNNKPVSGKTRPTLDVRKLVKAE